MEMFSAACTIGHFAPLVLERGLPLAGKMLEYICLDPNQLPRWFLISARASGFVSGGYGPLSFMGSGGFRLHGLGFGPAQQFPLFVAD